MGYVTKIVSKLGFSIVRGPLEGGGGEELTKWFFLGEAHSSFIIGFLLYVWLLVVNNMVLVEIIWMYLVEEEGPCEDVWSINFYWDGNGSINMTGVELFFKKLLISSWQGQFFMKSSSTHGKQGYLAFYLGFLSLSKVVVLVLSCWFLGF